MITVTQKCVVLQASGAKHERDFIIIQLQQTGKNMSARERRIKEGLSSAEIELNGASKTLKELGFCRISNDIELIKAKVQSIKINPDDLTVKKLQAINACIAIADSFDGLLINNQHEEVITAIKLGRELKEILTA